MSAVQRIGEAPPAYAEAAGTGFAARLLAWFDRHGRHDLPWQHPRTPYRVWLSEVMLQQTQVATVKPYFERFVARFPDLAALAQAPLDDVLAQWSGLGYYARARNLHRCAQRIMAEHGGVFPDRFDALLALPGIGRSTAGAILAQAFGQRAAILDGNVRRLLARYGAVPGWPGAPAVQRRLWALSESLLPDERLADYTQALMDLGASVCTARAPSCARCPLADGCLARAHDAVALYPAARPARTRPQRSVRVLLVRDGAGALLLEQRAARGIWGGLWCPPLLDDAALASGTWAQRLLDSAPAARPGPALRHAFTHFELTLSPLHVRAGGAAPQGCRWVTLAALGEIGLPAPIRRLIAQSPGTDP